MASIDMVVVNYKTYDLTDRFLSSYRRFKPSTKSYMNLIDNETNLDKLCKLEVSEVEVYPFEENLGYAKACNFGASLGDSEYIGLFNSDTEFVDDRCVDQCVEYLEAHPDVGIVGPFQFSMKDGIRRITNAGIFGTNDKPAHRAWQKIDHGEYRTNEQCLMVMGSAMFIRREAWDILANDSIFRKHYPEALGAMPEHPLYFEDTVLCYLMPHFGFKVVYMGEAEMMHRWHETISKHGDNNNFKVSREMFRSLLDDYGVEHD